MDGIFLELCLACPKIKFGGVSRVHDIQKLTPKWSWLEDFWQHIGQWTAEELGDNQICGRLRDEVPLEVIHYFSLFSSPSRPESIWQNLMICQSSCFFVLDSLIDIECVPRLCLSIVFPSLGLSWVWLQSKLVFMRSMGGSLDNMFLVWLLTFWLLIWQSAKNNQQTIAYLHFTILWLDFLNCNHQNPFVCLCGSSLLFTIKCAFA